MFCIFSLVFVKYYVRTTYIIRFLPLVTIFRLCVCVCVDFFATDVSLCVALQVLIAFYFSLEWWFFYSFEI